MITKEKALSMSPNIQEVRTYPIEGISWETLKDKINQANGAKYPIGKIDFPKPFEATYYSCDNCGELYTSQHKADTCPCVYGGHSDESC